MEEKHIHMKLEKNSLEFKDSFVESALKNANHKVLMNDFDKKLMQSIHHAYEYKKDIHSQLKASMRYVIIGILLIVVYILFTIITKSIVNETINLFFIILLFFSIGISVIFISNYRRLIMGQLF